MQPPFLCILVYSGQLPEQGLCNKESGCPTLVSVIRWKSCGCTPPPCPPAPRDPCGGTCPPPPPFPCPPPCPCPVPPDCSPDPGSHGAKQWRNISLFVALPVILILMAHAYMKHEEEHTKPRQEYIPYDYLFRRTKRWPWGDGNHSLFHNPKTNAIPPDGYEVEDENVVKKTDADES